MKKWIAFGSIAMIVASVGVVAWRMAGRDDAWRAFERRQRRLAENCWNEVSPREASGLSADWVTGQMEDSFWEECRAAVEALKAVAPTETRRAELDAELVAARHLAYEISGESSGNGPGGNVADRQVREQAMEPFLRNWFAGAEHPKEWEMIRSARGTFLGEAFVATNGVAVLDPPGQDRRFATSSVGQVNPEDTEDIRGTAGVFHRLIRLAPERVTRTNDGFVIGFDILDPWIMDSSSRPGSGEFILRDGILHERQVKFEE